MSHDQPVDTTEHESEHDQPEHDEHEHFDDAHADEHAHDHDDDHGLPAEDPKWVLAPLLVGFVIGAVILIVLGIGSGVPEF